MFISHFPNWYDMIYLTAIGLTPGGSKNCFQCFCNIVRFVYIVHVTFCALNTMFKQYCGYCSQSPRHRLQRLSHAANRCNNVSDKVLPAMLITYREYCIQCLWRIVNSSNNVYATFGCRLNVHIALWKLPSLLTAYCNYRQGSWRTLIVACNVHNILWRCTQCLCVSYNARYTVNIAYTAWWDVNTAQSVLIPVSELFPCNRQSHKHGQ